MNVRLSLVTAAIAIVAALIARPAPAQASFEVCNHTSEKTYVAVVDDWFLGEDSDGWFNLDAGECTTAVTGDISGDVVYLYAESTSFTWSGDNYYCVDPVNRFHFEDDNAESSCPTDIKRGFRKIDTGDYKDFTYTLNSD